MSQVPSSSPGTGSKQQPNIWMTITYPEEKAVRGVRERPEWLIEEEGEAGLSAETKVLSSALWTFRA